MSTTRKVNPLIQAVNESIRDSRINAQRMQQRAKDLEAQRMLIRAKFSDMLKGFNTDKHYVGVGLSGQTPQISITLNKLESFKDTDLTNLLEFLVGKEATIKEWFVKEGQTIKEVSSKKSNDVEYSTMIYARSSLISLSLRFPLLMTV